MPFDAFTQISEDDLKALWSYFRSLPPIRQQNRENELTFPFSIRYGMLVWRTLFFRAQWFEPDPTEERPMESRRLSGRGAWSLR